MTSEQKKDKLKVVISLNGDKASVGVQAPECDPAFFSLEGDLKTVLKAVSKFIEEALTRWKTNKLNPKCESPLPSQVEAAAAAKRTPAASRGTKTTTPKAKTDQRAMF